MVKQKADPISAITRSKDGQSIARVIIIIVVETRMTTFRTPRVKPDAPTRVDESGSWRGPKPRRLSTVVKIGRALTRGRLRPHSVPVGLWYTYFSGSLVNGRIAMQITIRTDTALG